MNQPASTQGARWQRRKSSRPSEILAAASDLFVSKGFSATKLDDVARQAGVSKGTVYLYFKNKETLFRELVKSVVVPALERAEAHAASHDGSAEDLLRQLIGIWQKSMRDPGLCGLPKLVISEAGNFPDLARFYVDTVVKRVRHLVMETLKAGVRSGEFRSCDYNHVARVIIGAMVFASVWECSLAPFDDEPYETKKYFEAYIDITLKGLRV
ncbi:MAG: TetR/AcrR family transcriptional regulator [Gammaproteobacteria bacterium]|nr:MAG: TetR/AcrR family transcriptional regulator [Gammaproteobacteria bacterium]